MAVLQTRNPSLTSAHPRRETPCSTTSFDLGGLYYAYPGDTTAGFVKADNFEIYPLLLFSFVQHDPTGGSIYPATWSAMLAARAEGVGSSLTSVLLFENDTVLDVLGVPAGEGWLMSSCVTFGYPTGRWGVAARRPAHEVAYRNRWGTDVGLSIDAPLWPDRDVPPAR